MHTALKVISGTVVLFAVTCCFPGVTSRLSTAALIRVTAALGVVTAGYLAWVAITVTP